MQSKKTIITLLILAATSIIPDLAQAEQALAIERASGERLSGAVAHYGRARMYLLAAIREFDQGMKAANANTLLDTNKFRATLVNRANELERVLDPQPRASNSGVTFSPDPRLIGEAR
jgi:hypothetical protein